MKTNPLPALLLHENQRYTIPESIALLRSSRATVYKLIDSGRLATIKEGRRRYVPGSAIAALSRVRA